MRKFDYRLLMGLLLIIAGAMFLLEALDLIVIGGWLWGLAFLVAAAAFIYVYFTNREHWWPLIPGCTLAGIGLTILTGELGPPWEEFGGFFVLAGIGLSFLLIYLTRRDYWWALIPGCTMAGIGVGVLAEGLMPSFSEIVPFFVLGGIGLSFLLIYLTRRDYWWTLIPAGTMFSVALMIVSERLFRDDAGIVGVLFLGLAITFAVLGMISTPSGRMKWPWIPAAVLGIIGVLVVGAGFENAGIAFGLVMVAVGAYFIFRTVRSR
jgi:hypothetical protein